MHAQTWPAVRGEIRPSPSRIAWLALALITGPLLAVRFVTPGAIAIWMIITAVTLCAGHSVGLHRGLIHGALKMGKTTERVLIYLAAQTGMGGPLTMMGMHDLRDRWQNQNKCPEYYGYGHGATKDAWWYMCCEHVPQPDDLRPQVDPKFATDAFQIHIDRHWRAHVVATALPLYALGGVPWIVWGVAMRVTTAILGHWLVNYLAHTRGDQPWVIEGAGEHGRNYKWLGALSMGEGWHNNHHAFPRSAQLGIEKYQLDPGWMLIRLLQRAGLVWDVYDAKRAGPRKEAHSGQAASSAAGAPTTAPAGAATVARKQVY